MRSTDVHAFTAMLDTVCRLLSRGAYVPDDENAAVFFRAMQRFELDQVRAAFDAHVADPVRGRFVPVPADLIAQIEGAAKHDGRPTADEAWPIAWSSRDEFETVVWTTETALAWSAVRSLASTDEVGARLAFRAAYERLVVEARDAGLPVQWVVAEGFDVARRAVAVTRAVELGRLPPPARVAIAGPDGHHPEGTHDDGQPPALVWQELRGMADQMRLRTENPEPGADLVAKVATSTAKQATAEAVAEELGLDRESLDQATREALRLRPQR